LLRTLHRVARLTGMAVSTHTCRGSFPRARLTSGTATRTRWWRRCFLCPNAWS